MGSLLGAFVGGLLVSVAESLGAVFLKPSLKELFSFSLLIVILLFRPAGLFGKRAACRRWFASRVTSRTHRGEDRRWMFAIRPVPERSSGFRPRRNHVCVARFPLCGVALLDVGAGRLIGSSPA